MLRPVRLQKQIYLWFVKILVMGIATRFFRWSHTYQSYLLLVARIVLGVVLLLKGIFFISHAQHLRELILQSRFAAAVGFFTAYVTFAHLFGGVFIIIGLFTRIAALLQVPVLLGAIFFYSSREQRRLRFRLYSLADHAGLVALCFMERQRHDLHGALPERPFVIVSTCGPLSSEK